VQGLRRGFVDAGPERRGRLGARERRELRVDEGERGARRGERRAAAVARGDVRVEIRGRRRAGRRGR
jgi:hypothetical protein